MAFKRKSGAIVMTFSSAMVNIFWLKTFLEYCQKFSNF